MENPEVNQNTFAAICGVTPQTLRDWVREGLPNTKPSRNSTRFRLIEAVGWVRDHKWLPELDDKARKLKAEADMAEMERDQLAGTLLASSDVMQTWTDALAALRANLMAYPDRVLSRLEACVTPAERVAVLRGEMKASLEGLVKDAEAQAIKAQAETEAS